LETQEEISYSLLQSVMHIEIGGTVDR